MRAPVRSSVQDSVVRQLVIKLHSRCNLSCDYCYVYHSVDQTWQRQPVTMSAEIIARVAARVVEHVQKHDLDSVSVVLHGGEPLLAGPEGVEAALAAIRTAVPAATTVRFGVQTNGILLDERFLKIFHRYGVRVGVSLDGGRAATDRHRRYVNGRGSYDRTATGLRLLAQSAHREIYAGLLCTIDVRNDPVQVYEDLVAFEPPSIDLLLPHGNWSNPPPRPTGAMSYGEWLIAVFDAWYGDPRGRTRIRLFESMIMRMLGGPSGTEAVGGDQPGIVIIETDGSYEQSDALKTTVDGGAATGLDVHAQSLDDVLRHLETAAPVRLAPECQACPIERICGGGLRAHRFGDGSFDHPSVFCPDLFAVIRHIEQRVTADLAPREVVP